MQGNDFTLVGIVASEVTFRTLDRGRVHQALFDISTGQDVIACQMSRSSEKSLKRVAARVVPGRLMAATGILDTRIADLGPVRVPLLIPFVQHLHAGALMPIEARAGVAEGARLTPPISLSRFRVAGVVTSEALPFRADRTPAAQVSLRAGGSTFPVVVLAPSPAEVETAVGSLVKGAEVEGVGYLRMRKTGTGFGILEAVAVNLRLNRRPSAGAAERAVVQNLRDASRQAAEGPSETDLSHAPPTAHLAVRVAALA